MNLPESKYHQKPVMDPSGATDQTDDPQGSVSVSSLAATIRQMAEKHAKPSGTPYEEGGWDMAMRIIGLLGRADLAAEPSDKAGD